MAIACSPALPGTSDGFTESMATRSRNTSIVSSRKIHLGATFLLNGAVVCDRCRGRVLKAAASRIENELLVVARASGLAAGDDCAELRVHVIARHCAGGNGGAKVADFRTLIDDIRDDSACAHQRWVDLRLGWIIGTDRGDEGRAITKECGFRWRAGDDHVAGGRCRGAGPFDVQRWLHLACVL